LGLLEKQVLHGCCMPWLQVVRNGWWWGEVEKGAELKRVSNIPSLASIVLCHTNITCSQTSIWHLAHGGTRRPRAGLLTHPLTRHVQTISQQPVRSYNEQPTERKQEWHRWIV